MRPHDRHATGASYLSASRALARQFVLGLCLLLPLAIGTIPVQAAQPAPAAQSPLATTHVYLLRGVLNIFSLGLDTIGARLEAQGIPVTVTNFMHWSGLADEAIAAYKAGRLKTIILVGHSSGATALPDMIAKFNQFGVPVKLAIGLDSVFKTKLSTGAERYINLYISDGPGEPVRAADGFRGRLDNVDVRSTGVGHVSIDKNELIQRRVIAEIDAVVLRQHKAPAASAGPTAKPARSAAATAPPARN
ncbi:hypothetical protein [Bradyrhizobium sp.]|uniref:hypothetical protein n=1 Tax=Bradyrhizobium sp. TaxID=376 RepID=UPI00238FC994|nr:hypothetical protein [Bradyrhizobium sp.]MDE2380317.1 hypothetical protein [Bradyrhizobium sp.]